MNRLLWRGGAIVVATLAVVLFYLQFHEANSVAEGAGVAWLTYDEAMIVAAESGRPVLIDFYADWCAPCKQMESTTLRDQQVVELIESRFVPVRLELTEDGCRKLVEQYGVHVYPTFVIADAAGNVIRRFHGYRSARPYLRELEQALRLRPQAPRKIAM